MPGLCSVDAKIPFYFAPCLAVAWRTGHTARNWPLFCPHFVLGGGGGQDSLGIGINHTLLRWAERPRMHK